ncbi:MAG TPA: aminopeptidase [Acidimicrobiales bacterium]|nr:aminopeptidase [Acidimicrobiales bacterium]
MGTERMERYAELIVRVGANVQPGQTVYVFADVAHLDVVRAIADSAYLAGAFRVVPVLSDDRIRLSAVRHAPMESLSAAAEWELTRVRGFDDESVALIRLTGAADPHLFDGLDPHRLAAMPVELAIEQRRALMRGAVSWTVAAAPNPGWAEQVFGEPDVDRLWDAVAGPLRLDDPDPVASWREHHQKLADRATALSAIGLDAVRYRGDGTDLTVGLVRGGLWTGGGLTTLAGVLTMPNLPTEEVFTSPDRNQAEGTLRLTRPLVMPRTGAYVTGLEARFDSGRIVDVRAEQGAEAVSAELDTDEGARFLGEVSLVDADSRVRAADVVFHDTLYDENAGCHVAWGQSFPFAVPGGTSRTPEELSEYGLNVSAVHTDVVIGGDGIDVDGLKDDGTTVPIIKDNRWVLPV